MVIKIVSKYNLTDVGFFYSFVSYGHIYDVMMEGNADKTTIFHYLSYDKINGSLVDVYHELNGKFRESYTMILERGRYLLSFNLISGGSFELCKFIICWNGKNFPLGKLCYINGDDIDVYINGILMDENERIEYISTNESYLYEFLSRVPKRDRCIIFGNGPSLGSIDLDIFKGETTISCNHFLEESKFVPTINCAGDYQLIMDKICNGFEYDNLGTYKKYGIIYLFYPFSFIGKCKDDMIQHNSIYKFNKYEEIKYSRRYLEKFQKILNENQLMYIINSIVNLSLTHDIYSMIGDDNNVKENVYHINRYYNVIPLISMVIAKFLGVKRIYLIGCDGKNFDNHFYVKQTGERLFSDMKTKDFNSYYNLTLNGFIRKKIEFDKSGIDVINCSDESVYTFYRMIPLKKLINNYHYTFDDIDKYVCMNEMNECDNELYKRMNNDINK